MLAVLLCQVVKSHLCETPFRFPLTRENNEIRTHVLAAIGSAYHSVVPCLPAWPIVPQDRTTNHPLTPTSRPCPIHRFSPRTLPGARLAQEELRHFVLAIASRHPDLAYLSGSERLLYVDTVLVMLFYEFRCV